jgi:transposase
MANSNVDGGTPSDLSAGGQTRKSDMRAAINAILYLLRAACPWRYLPRDRFPPRSTVYNIFRKFQREGTWEAIWAELHMALRERMGRQASPSAAVLDSQSLKSAERMARPVGKQFRRANLSSLHQRIRSQATLAKMEIRASRAS